MLDEALSWVQRNTKTRIRFGPNDQMRDEPEFPVEAVRELLSNALIHRDLGPYALIQAITLRLEEQQLVLSNPGGLWGISVDRLGRVGVTSARNGHLLRICQNVRSGDGNRFVEALATGIPAVLKSLREAGMVAPRFHDRGISFTVSVSNHALLAADDLQWLATLEAAAALSDRRRHALVAMRHGHIWTDHSFRETFPMDSHEARQELAGLVDAGVAVAEGEGRGRAHRLSGLLASNARPKHTETPRPRIAANSHTPKAPRGPSTITRRAGSRTNPNAARIADELGSGAKTANELVAATGLTARQVQYALQGMRADNLVTLVGKPGQSDSRYELHR